MGIINNPRYCYNLDYNNIENTQNVFGKINFFTDYNVDGLTRGTVMKNMGYDTMPDDVTKDMSKSLWNSVLFIFLPLIF